MTTGAHGLSLLITTEVGDEKHTFIFDCGPESKSIDRNVKALEVDLTSVEAIALSVSSVSLSATFMSMHHLIIGPPRVDVALAF